jgi:hypothetical protein
MLVSGSGIVAFVNSAGGGHRDRLIERFIATAMSDAQLKLVRGIKLIAMKEGEPQDGT